MNHAATCRLMPSEEISSQEPLEWCARGGDGNGGKRRAGKGGGGITVPPSPVVEAGSRIRARRFFWQIPQETLALGVPPARCGDARKPGSVPKCHRCWSHRRASSWPPPEERGDLILRAARLPCKPELFLQGARFLHPLPPAPRHASPGEGRGTAGRRLGGRIRAGGLQARLGKAKEDRGGNVEAGELHEPTQPPRSIPPWPFPLHQSFLRRRSCGCQEQNKGVGRPGLLLGRSPWG